MTTDNSKATNQRNCTDRACSSWFTSAFVAFLNDNTASK